MAEITPLLSSTTAVTEVPSADSHGFMPTFNAEAAVGVKVTFTFATNALQPGSATAVLTVPPAIPGRPDLTFEFQPGRSGSAVTVLVPMSALGRSATLTLVPLPPDDERIPPRTFAVTLAASLPIVVQSDDVTVRGKLLTAAEEVPADQFVARIFQDGVAASNSALVSLADGGFSLLLPAARAAGQFRLQLSQRNPIGPNPSFISNTIAFTANVGTIKLPAYTAPDQFQVTVVGPDESPIPGALVRASTTLPQADPSQPTLGSTVFQRDAIAALEGTASLSLIPGTFALLRYYELAVIPPAMSPFATRCFRQPVAAGGRANNSASLQALVLPPRRLLFGTVTASNGAPVPDLVVTATTTSAIADCEMSAVHAASGSATTGPDGTFQLPLDPGSYQLDFDPPAGAPVPRLTRLDLLTMGTDSDVDASVTLPAASVVDGRVMGLDKQQPLPLAGVRIYQPRCIGTADCFGPARTAPSLLAVAQTDAIGRFRVILPAPP